jgi:hypothetical protein
MILPLSPVEMATIASLSCAIAGYIAATARVSYKRVGGLRFVRFNRLTFSFCVSNKE